MIICTNKKLEVYKLSRPVNQIYLMSDLQESKTNIGFAKLYSDIGCIPILIAKNKDEMLFAREMAEKDKGLNIVFIYSDNELDEIFRDSSVLHVKTDSSLDVAIETHIKENLYLYDNLTSSSELVEALSKNPDTKATLFTQNICTIYKDRVDTGEVSSEECNYYLDLNIENTEELKRLISAYFGAYISSHNKKEDSSDSSEFSINAFFSVKSKSEAIRKIYYISDIL